MGSSRYTPLRSILNSILPLLQVISICFMSWKGLSLLADTPYPLMIVITDSMAPAFQPGDVLFVSNHHREVQTGDLPVCWVAERPFPMVHRVIQVFYQDEGPRQRYCSEPVCRSANNG